MATNVQRDYSLSGGLENVTPLDDNDIIEERMVEKTWWTPDIPRADLKALMERKDGPALWHFTLWIVLLIGSGYLAWISWGTWWAIPAFFVYGTIYSSSDARWHECGHGTPFRTRWLNEIFYHISSFMTIREAYLWRWSHARHHTDTIIVGRDPEIQVKRPADLLKIAMDFLDIRSGPLEVMRVVRHAMAIPDADVRDFMPPEELNKMYWSSRIYLMIVGAFAVWALAIGSFLPMMFVWLPRFYGGWLHQLLGLTQHAGLGEDTYDHRENTRTVYVNPVFRYLYMNMNYHVEHHTIPMIPYHALPKAHEYFLPQSPPPYKNLWQVYREMLPTLYKQATEDPDYHIQRPIPASASAAVTVAEVTAESQATRRVEVAEDGWVRVCAVADLDENDVLAFDYEDQGYALYRTTDDTYYASDALCTHGRESLAGGMVLDGCIECPKHNGRFDLASGEAVRTPARKPLQMYRVDVRGDAIFVSIPVAEAVE